MTNNNLHGNKPQNGRADAGFVARSGAQMADAPRQGATAGQQGGQVINEAVRRSVEATADMARQGTQVGVEATRRARETANETARRSSQVVAEGQRQIAQEAAQTFRQVSHHVAQVAHSTSEDVRQLATLPHAAEGGLRDMQQGIAGLIEGVVRTNLRATQEMFRLTNPVAIIELQQRFMGEYMDALMQGTATLVRAVRRTADETLHPLEVQVAQRQQAHRNQRTAAE